jgi:hypothetical protein
VFFVVSVAVQYKWGRYDGHQNILIWPKRFTRAFAVAGIAVLAMSMGNGTTSAGVDNSSSVVDSRGNRIEVLQGDTSYQVVPPLDGVPTSVEFFHNGYAEVNIRGPNAAEFTGTKLTVGSSATRSDTRSP